MSLLSDLIARRDEYIKAEAAIVTSGQTYSIEGLSLTRADLTEVTSMIDRLNREISNLQDKNAGRTAGVAFPKWNS